MTVHRTLRHSGLLEHDVAMVVVSFDPPWQSARQHGVFTSEQAYAAGWTHTRLSRAVDSGRLLRLRRGAFVATELVPAAPRAERQRILAGLGGAAAALRIHHATISHQSAAALHGLPLLNAPGRPCITLPPALRTRTDGLHVHRQPLPSAELDPNSDLPMTSVARTCLDVTREAGLLAGVVVSDAALHRGLIVEGDLAAQYDGLRGRAGLSDGRAILELTSGLSESPLESISRVNMRALPVQPEEQVTLYDEDGFFLGRADFFWRAAGLVGEADGMAKYDETELRREKRRQDGLHRAGLFVTRWGWAAAMNPARLCAQIERDLARALGLRRAGIPAAIHAA